MSRNEIVSPSIPISPIANRQDADRLSSTAPKVHKPRPEGQHHRRVHLDRRFRRDSFQGPGKPIPHHIQDPEPHTAPSHPSRHFGPSQWLMAHLRTIAPSDWLRRAPSGFALSPANGVIVAVERITRASRLMSFPARNWNSQRVRQPWIELGLTCAPPDPQRARVDSREPSDMEL